MGIVVENGGVLTTVQDEGRFGYQAYGVSTSGAMDSHAFHIANLLVGNEMTEGALEMTFIGPVLRFTQDNMIAITGGDLAWASLPHVSGSSCKRRSETIFWRHAERMPGLYCFCRRPGCSAGYGK